MRVFFVCFKKTPIYLPFIFNRRNILINRLLYFSLTFTSVGELLLVIKLSLFFFPFSLLSHKYCRKIESWPQYCESSHFISRTCFCVLEHEVVVYVRRDAERLLISVSLCFVTGIGETDTALRAETAEGTNRSPSRLPESRCWTRSPLVETTGWVGALYISSAFLPTSKTALTSVSLHQADDGGWV